MDHLIFLLDSAGLDTVPRISHIFVFLFIVLNIIEREL